MTLLLIADTIPSGGLLDVGQAFSQSLAPFINAAIQAVLALGLAWLAWWLKSKWGIDIDQSQRDTLQTWLTNQASSLVADGAVRVSFGANGIPSISVDQNKLAQHAAEIGQHIPDAAAYFKLSPQLVAAKIVDKLPQVPAVASQMAGPPKQ